MKIALSCILKLSAFFEEVSDKNLQIDTLYKIFTLKQNTQENILFYQQNLEKIINKYALLDEQGRPKTNEKGILISSEYLDECVEKINQLSEFLVEKPDINFKLSEFNDIKLTLKALEAIYPFII